MENNESLSQDNGTETVETQEERTFTQAEVNEIVKARVGKERARFSDYAAMKEKASKFDEMQEAGKSELQKATERADKLQKRLDDLTHANDQRTMREKVSAETGVPANLLTADTEEACRSQAEGILAFRSDAPKYPNVKDGGEPRNNVNNMTDVQAFETWFKSQKI